MKKFIRKLAIGLFTLITSVLLIGCVESQSIEPMPTEEQILPSSSVSIEPTPVEQATLDPSSLPIGGSTGINIYSHGGPIEDHFSFVDQLRAKGLTVEPNGYVQQPLIAIKGNKLHISGGTLQRAAELQTFDYDNPTSAIQAADKFNSGGLLKRGLITWHGPMHWFRKERLIVLYVGNDKEVRKLLEELLGSQFAGL